MAYIECEAAGNAVLNLVPKVDCDGYCWVIRGDAARAIGTIPAADVRPVVKAKWVYTDMSRLVCSNCGNPVAFALKEDGWHHGDYCSNCGARMEES